MPINLVIKHTAQSVLSNFWFVLRLQGIRLEKRVTTEKRKRSDPPESSPFGDFKSVFNYYWQSCFLGFTKEILFPFPLIICN